ncbi:prepilin-type N-terminal cleavage/methylation domain-containing protein [Sporosarcina sp. 179-K 8C2 HS]|uniref:type II secretion system protein n=1 Tax=Sporosarcina sp. 179-K 8C2 HS TaxID=3142387 RepID=UPI00399F6522
MKKFLQKRLKNEKGLTLVELLAVIVILGIIAAIAVPAIGNIIVNSKYNAVKADAINVLNAANLYFVENPEETSVVVNGTDKSLVKSGYLENQGLIPDAASVAKSSPNTLTATDVEYSKGKKVTFSAATIQKISDDNQKGSGTPAAITGATGGTTGG